MTQPYMGKWWHKTEDFRFQCDLCPRHCILKPGQKGFCFVREANDDGIVLSTYGRSSGFCIDPIEKKPLYHFYPGTSVLSFGTAGCNLACKFCQNWDISKAKTQDRLASYATPKVIAETALKYKCKSVAFTYNDPTIFAEYAIDTAIECRKRDIKTISVSAGYISAQAREELYSFIDAANIDLKGFTNEFYEKYSSAKLTPVLETLEYLAKKTKVWLEVTTLLIPTLNDSEEEVDRLTKWIRDHLGETVPLHFSAFHPDFKMLDIPETPIGTLTRAREIALKNGLKYVFTGNVHDSKGESTYCPQCKSLLIERDWYRLGDFNIIDGKCRSCGYNIAGYFENNPGHWGAKRLPIAI